MAAPPPAGHSTTQAPLPAGELADRRTRNSKTSRNANGTYTTTVAAGPINYRDSQGKWQPIDSMLTTASSSGYAWSNRANDFQANFKAKLASNYLRIDTRGKSFGLSLDGVSPANAVVKGSRVTYAGAFPGVDLRYDVGASGVKETLLLANSTVSDHYQFTLTAPTGTQVSTIRGPDGSWQFFLPPQDDPVLVLAQPQVADAGTSANAVAEPEKEATLNVSRSGANFSIDLSIDKTWLQDAKRVFPVELDPTMTIQPDSQDAYFHGNVATDGGFHDNNGMIHIGDSDTHYDWSAEQFGLSSIPANAQISSASLGLFYNGYCISTTNPCGGTTHTLEAHRMTAAWSPSSQTQQLAYDSTVLSTVTMTLDSNYRWLNWDVTGTVQNWYGGTQPNYGLLLKRSTEVLGGSGPALPSNQYTTESTLGPKLDVTYTADAVVLSQPTTLHSNGADLSWTAFAGSTSFQKYEVHRSTTANFTPSSTTLLATITDAAVTSYRDTTARAGTTFYYNVVANTSASNYIQVTLPADGQATKTLQPGPEGKDTYNFFQSGSTICSTYGKSDHMTLGTDTNRISRAFLSFPLNDIPTGSTIQSATLALWHYQTAPGANTMHAYRVTRDWAQGSSNSSQGACTGDGVTWYEANGGIAWASQGGDFASGASDQSGAVTVPAGQAPSWTSFTITPIAQQWANGTAPNYGVMVKLDSEALVAGNLLRYYAGDYTGSASLRPKLTLTYSDGSHAIAPTVGVGSPAAGAVVRGSSVVLSAGASDDGRVVKVEFYVDGSLVGTSTATPYTYTWNSALVGNGSHSVTAKAYDDAGNVTTSSGVAITVSNYANPTTSISAPAANASVSGTVNVSATASVASGLTVSKLEFYFDNTLFATVNAPASGATSTVSWNTFDSTQPAFDGTRALTTKVYDSSGLIITSAAVNVTVANTAGTQYKATIAPASATGVPQGVVYDPALGSNQTTYPVQINLTNTSLVTWSNTTTFLRYRWVSSDSPAVTTDGPNVSLPSSIPAGGSANNIVVTVSPPTLDDGVNAAQYNLRFDVFDSSTSSWFAVKGNQPSDNPVIVSKALKTSLGLEKYYAYSTQDVGGGMQSLVNVANGDSILHYTPFTSPGRGLATVVGLTYNSLENHSDSPAGNNWSLSISSLSRFGNPIDIHPNNADTIAGRSNRWIQFIDGDGTPHRFQGFVDGSGVVYWIEPPGVHLYLRQYSTTDTTRWWALTRPDRVTFFYNQDGYPTFVTDRFGNTLTYTLTAVQPGDDPGGPKFHITSVTDAGGRSYAISYFVKADSVKSHVRGKIKSISDHSGHALNFSYYDDGNLLRLTERGGTNADGTSLADRSWVFTYTTPSGGVSGCSASCDAPAIPTASARINPDPKTPSESTRIYSVREPNGNADTSRPETRFFYYGPASSNLDRWKLSTLVDRGGNTTTFAWDNVNRVATVTPPAPGGQSRVTRYAYDTDGKPTTITNPLNQTTVLQWNGDFAVTSLQETGGANYVTTYTDNENGYLTDRTDPLAHTTHLGYTNLAIDSNDVAAHWCTSAIAATTPCYPRSIGHASVIMSKTDPLGMPAASSYTWRFAYQDAAKTQLSTITDPINNVTTYTPNPDGTVASVKDARNNTTTYSYDANGLVTQVVDPIGNSMKASYDADGHVVWVQDANHAASTGSNDSQYRTKFYYDSFHRLGRTTQPKFPAFNPPGSTVLTETLITRDLGYDANGNTVSQTTPYYTSADRFVTTIAYDVMDRQTLVTSPDTSADPAGERTKYQYDAAGRLTQITLPIGMQAPDVNNTHNIFYAYDALDRVVSQTRNNVQSGTVRTLVTVGCYNAAGDLTSVTQPLAGLTASTINCASTTLNYTTYYQYDLDHRTTLTKDPNGNTQTAIYDANGNVTTVKDANTNPTNYTYDQLNRVIEIDQPFVATTPGTVTRYVKTKIAYDAAGNRSALISPRAVDVGGSGPYTKFVTTYEYDADNRLIKTTLPFDDNPTPANPNFSTPYYIHQQYDPNGNVVMTSLPDDHADPGLVPASKKTTIQYYDTGSVYSTQDGSGPRSYFDYTATGQQSLKVPSDSAGNLDTAHRMQWVYFADGKLKQREDRGNQLISYTYDADNVLKTANNAAGATDGSNTNVTVTPDDMDRLATVQSQTTAATTQTTYLYDLNGNISDSVQDAQTAPASKPGRNLHYDYDQANWLKDQCTLATPPTPGSCINPTSSSDQRIVTTYWPTGWTKSREQDQGGASWTPKQTTTWDYFANGKLNLLNTYNGSTTATKVESHTVAYTATPTDTASLYLDGNRTRDTFFMLGSGTTACRVSTSPCNDDYTYDPRGRVVKESKGDGTVTSYFNPAGSGNLGLDPSGNIGREQIVSGGVTTIKDYQYSGNQLQSVTTNGVDVSNYWYNDDGDLWCVTSSAGSKANCPISAQTTPPSSVKQAYAYDYLFRLQNYRAFSNGQLTDCANYKYDPFDRQIWEGETHGTGITCSDSKTTQLTFAGLSNNVTQEQQSSGGTLQTTKDYSYDVYGHRATETVTPNGQASTTYTYAYNVHDSVSLLLDLSGNTKASYAYRPYGDQDSVLSGGDPDKNNPFNAYRYAAKRFDSGSQTIDTGARRFATDTSKFLQPDQFNGAFANLSLGSDPLSQNRYSLAGGNPMSFIEWDGHFPTPDGGGYSDPAPSPSQNWRSLEQLAADAVRDAVPEDWTVKHDSWLRDPEQQPIRTEEGKVQRPDVQALDPKRRLRILVEVKSGVERYTEKVREQMKGRLKTLGESIEDIITVILKRSPNGDITGELGNEQADPEQAQRIRDELEKRGVNLPAPGGTEAGGTSATQKFTIEPQRPHILADPILDPGPSILINTPGPQGPHIIIDPIPDPLPRCCITVIPELPEFREYYPIEPPQVRILF